jgi:hypothetical protein
MTCKWRCNRRIFVTFEMPRQPWVTCRLRKACSILPTAAHLCLVQDREPTVLVNCLQQMNDVTDEYDVLFLICGFFYQDCCHQRFLLWTLCCSINPLQEDSCQRLAYYICAVLYFDCHCFQCFVITVHVQVCCQDCQKKHSIFSLFTILDV